MQREFKLVAVRNLHQSTILPPREHNPELSESVKKMGLQQMPIVRAIPLKPDEFEVVDGAGRLGALRDDDQIFVDIRYDVKDSEIFEISSATFSRKDRSTYETSLFYDAWLKALEKESGSSEGLQEKLAGQANLSESSVSQYLSISRLFGKLQEIAPKEQFSKLKTWSINKLYKLSELTHDPRLLDLARFFELKFETELEEVIDAVDSYRGTKQPQEAPFDLGSDKPEPDQSATSIERQFTASSNESRKIFLKNAKKVASLATETYEALNTITQELVQDADRLSSTEILQILTRVLHTLRKLRQHSNVLKQKIKPQIKVAQ